MYIAFLSTYFKPDITANGILMTQLAEELVAQGHKLTVVTSMPHYSTNHIWPEYQGKLWVRETWARNIDVTRLYIHVPQDKTNLTGRLLGYVSFNLLALITLLWLPKYDLIFVPSPPLTNGMVGWLVSRLRRVPFVYNVQDIYPDVAVRLGVLQNPRLIRFFQWMERFVYSRAAAVSVISQGFRHNLRTKEVADEKIHIIPNFVDDAFICPQDRENAFTQEHSLADRFVVLFAGNVGLSQGLEHVLKAAQQLRQYEEIVFLIVGNGAAKAALIQQAKALGLDNLRFLPFQPHEQVASMYAAAHVGIVPLRHGVAQESVPSKVFSILGAARPVIAAVDADSDTATLIADAQCGLRVPPEDADALATAILQLRSTPDVAQTMGQAGYAYVRQHYTKQQVAAQYAQLFQALL
jgi:colanic acid biosynthesis glycosyl transferase WcaI